MPFTPIFRIREDQGDKVHGERLVNKTVDAGRKLMDGSITEPLLELPVRPWIPTYRALTVGDGTVWARYQEIDGMVTCHFDFTLGSTSSIGTNPGVSPPVPIHPDYINHRNGLGDVHILAGQAYAGQMQVSADMLSPVVYSIPTTYVQLITVTSTIPNTWATGHVLAFNATYEAA